jgi:hypothetical protein
MGPWKARGMLRLTQHGREAASDPKTLPLQASQGDRRGRTAGRWTGGTHGERAAEGDRASGIRHHRFSPNSGRAGGRAVHNTLATIRSKTGLEV